MTLLGQLEKQFDTKPNGVDLYSFIRMCLNLIDNTVDDLIFLIMMTIDLFQAIKDEAKKDEVINK